MIYLDIETAAVAYGLLHESTRDLWQVFCEGKFRGTERVENGEWEDLWNEQAALFPEFGLIVCVSYAIDEGKVFSLTAANDAEDEKELLLRLADGLRPRYSEKLCAHNGKGFDFHWLARRMVMHRVKLPNLLDTRGLKPWETRFVDTQEMWGFGDLRRTVRLDVLCHALGVDSPKEAMCGAEVPQAWRDGRIEEIRQYCERDVVALREVYEILRDA